MFQIILQYLLMFVAYLHETIDLAVDIIFGNNQNINIAKSQLKKHFVFTTSQTDFIFNNKFYDQTDGIAMILALGHSLANPLAKS